MKNYIVSDYASWADLSADLTAELNETIVDHIPAVHKTLGACEISKITISLNENILHFMADFEFESQTKRLALNILMANKLINKIAEPANTLLVDFIAACTELQKEVAEIAHSRKVEKLEANRLAKEEAQKEAKYQAAKEKAIQDFEVLARKDKSQLATGEFYYNLGWLAKNIGTVSAALPDYLLKYFENHFGTEAKPTVVDSRKRTVNGHPMQWALSMKASVAKKAVDKIPPFLKQFLNTTGNALTSTTFIWDIVENYGFKFGRKQDIDQIRSSIPTTYLKQFEKGFAA